MPSLLLRLPPELHDLVRIAAASKRQSVSVWIRQALNGAVLRQAARKRASNPLAAALDGIAVAPSSRREPPAAR